MLDIIEIKNKLGNGCTIPYVVWCSDNNSYVVKFPGNPEGKKTLVNEFIASRLCEYLKLPIMEYKLINVKTKDYKDYMKDDIEFVSGTAFGTVYDDNALPILNSKMISKTYNSYDAVKILIFDLLIGNFDRNNGNLMIDSVTKKLIMIDHTHIFELETLWDKYQLPRVINNEFCISRLNQFNYSNIIATFKYDKTFFDELKLFIKRVKNIDRIYVEHIMKDIPYDWNVTADEKQLLIEFIISRFSRVDEIIELLKLNGDDNDEK